MRRVHCRQKANAHVAKRRGNGCPLGYRLSYYEYKHLCSISLSVVCLTRSLVVGASSERGEETPTTRHRDGPTTVILILRKSGAANPSCNTASYPKQLGFVVELDDEGERPLRCVDPL